MKALKWIAYGIGGIVLLAIVVIAIVAATFDPNEYKPQIVNLVKERTGRTLTMDGKIGLMFFPKVGAEVERVTLSEPNGTQPFARIEQARVALALLPLLSKQIIVDRVTLLGLAVDLVRYRDGRTNFDDLIGAKPAAPAKPAAKPAEAPAGTPFAIDVGGIELRNASIGWRDERDGTDVRLSNVRLRTGRIASGVPGKLELAAKVDGKQPQLNLQVDLETGYRLNFETQAVALSALELKAAGNAPGLAGFEGHLKGEMVDFDPTAKRVSLSGIELAARSKDGLDGKFSIPKLQVAPERAESKAITGEVRLAKPQQSIDAKLALSALEAKGPEIRFARFDVDLDAKQANLAIQGKLGTPVMLNLDGQTVQLPGIAGDLTLTGPDLPGRQLKAAVQGGARADWGKRNANADLALKLDESNIQAKLAVANWADPALQFDVLADRLNVDHYFPPEKPAAAPAAGKSPAGGAAGKSPAGAAAEQPIDLSALKGLSATGNVRIGALQVRNIKAQQVNAAIKVAGGRLDVSPMSARLYDGTLAGAAVVNANDNRFTVKQTLAGVSVGPLLRDAANRDILEGRGNVALDVTASGTTVTALKHALGGTASLALKDGAIKGVDIPGAIRTAQAMLGSKRALEEQAKGGKKTDFSELTGTFAIKNGVAHNNDLQGKSPLLRLAGVGDIDIGAGAMDYTVKATVVATTTGQGGKELGRVAGVTVPVQIAGPFDNLKYTVDVAALAAGAATDLLTRELERRLGGGKAAPDGAQAAPRSGSELEDALRGLFGRKK
jgi:AsmA protein